MFRQRKRLLLGLLARYVVLVTVLGLVTTAVYATADADFRPTVLRLAVAAFVTIVLIHIHSHYRQQLEWAQPSTFDQARRGQPADAKVAPVVIRLRDQVQHSVASQRYFEEVLSPKLAQLSEERGTRERFHDLAGRRWLNRGPSLAAIAELIRSIGGRS